MCLCTEEGDWEEPGETNFNLQKAKRCVMEKGEVAPNWNKVIMVYSLIFPKATFSCLLPTSQSQYIYFLEIFLIGVITALRRCVGMNQHMYIHTSSLLGLPSRLSPLCQFITEHRAEIPVIYSSFPRAICFTHGSGYIPTLLSQFAPPSPSPALSTSSFSMFTVLFLPLKIGLCKYHFSRSELIYYKTYQVTC